MALNLDFRLATAADFRQLADLRWRLKTNDEPEFDAAAYDRFIEEFVTDQRSGWRPGEVYHWVAADEGGLVAAMSVIIVRKIPEPGDLHGRWGYLTNCYALPRVRNAGVGGRLLESVKPWAEQEALEMLVVWPSDRAYPFYQRSGFRRPADPLVLQILPD
jgi:GNAT superfamily N-acetyltransferase